MGLSSSRVGVYGRRGMKFFFEGLEEKPKEIIGEIKSLSFFLV